jgi:hypothetical protein
LRCYIGIASEADKIEKDFTFNVNAPAVASACFVKKTTIAPQISFYTATPELRD